MVFDPLSLVGVFGPMLYEMAKHEHQCVGCRGWKLNIRYVTRCCSEPICDSCASGGRHMIRVGGRRRCKNCPHEYD